MTKQSTKYVGNAESINHYAENSMSCIVAFECRSRGYDVTSVPYEKDNTSLRTLMKDSRAAWCEADSGKIPCFINLKSQNPSDLYDEIREHIKDGKRYMLEFEWFCQNLKHAIFVIHEDNNQMVVFDPMTGGVMKDAVAICGFFTWIKYDNNAGPKLLRVDNLGFNLDIVNDVVMARGDSDE